MSRSFIRQVSWCLVVFMVMVGITPRVEAGFCPSEMIPSETGSSEMIFSSPNGDRSADLQKIQKVLELKMIGERLEKLGFSQEEIRARLGQIDDRQIHQLALKIDELRAGGNGLDIVVGILIVAILVIILLQITGHKVLVTQR